MATIDFDQLVDLARPTGEARRLIGVAGAPGSGKSTTAEALVARLEAIEPGHAAVLPMDGYHFDDLLLNARGIRPRKGAPETFDVAGLRHMLLRLKENAEDEILVPVFDRDLEIARAGARPIARAVRTIVVEGNYLLLDQAPWTSLHSLFDVTVRIAVPEPVLRARLTARWQGYNLSPAEIRAKLEDLDLPNGRLINTHSITPDYLLAMNGD